MKGDVFNNCCGNATGDIVSNATGSECFLVTEYSATAMTQLRNEVSRSEGNLAIVKAKLADAERLASACLAAYGFRCQAKYGGTKNELLDRRNALRSEVLATEKAVTLAKTNLAQAEKALALATTNYNQCRSDELRTNKEEADRKLEQQRIALEAERQKDIFAVEAEKVNVEAKKVGVETIQASKDYFIYGLIGVGALTVIIMGFKILK